MPRPRAVVVLAAVMVAAQLAAAQHDDDDDDSHLEVALPPCAAMRRVTFEIIRFQAGQGGGFLDAKPDIRIGIAGPFDGSSGGVW
jgi:hypothetical protein